MRVRPWQTMQRHFLRFVTGVWSVDILEKIQWKQWNNLTPLP
jgi:hypothetical protein